MISRDRVKGPPEPGSTTAMLRGRPANCGEECGCLSSLGWKSWGHWRQRKDWPTPTPNLIGLALAGFEIKDVTHREWIEFSNDYLPPAEIGPWIHQGLPCKNEQTEKLPIQLWSNLDDWTSLAELQVVLTGEIGARARDGGRQYYAWFSTANEKWHSNYVLLSEKHQGGYSKVVYWTRTWQLGVARSTRTHFFCSNWFLVHLLLCLALCNVVLSYGALVHDVPYKLFVIRWTDRYLFSVDICLNILLRS